MQKPLGNEFRIQYANRGNFITIIVSPSISLWVKILAAHFRIYCPFFLKLP